VIFLDVTTGDMYMGRNRPTRDKVGQKQERVASMTEGKKKWGAGRVAFVSELAAIRAELALGHPITDIYESRKGRLGGISYSAFRKLVAKYARDARLSVTTATDPHPIPPPSPNSTTGGSKSSSPPPVAQTGTVNDPSRQPDDRPGFQYNSTTSAAKARDLLVPKRQGDK
jgi:hypothetical protein